MNLAVKFSSCVHRTICSAVSTFNIPVKVNSILLRSLLKEKKSEFINSEHYHLRLQLVNGLLDKSKQNGINTKDSYVRSKVNSYADSFCQALQDFVDRYEWRGYDESADIVVLGNTAIDMLMMNGIYGTKQEIATIIDFMIDYSRSYIQRP